MGLTKSFNQKKNQMVRGFGIFKIIPLPYHTGGIILFVVLRNNQILALWLGRSVNTGVTGLQCQGGSSGSKLTAETSLAGFKIKLGTKDFLTRTPWQGLLGKEFLVRTPWKGLFGKEFFVRTPWQGEKLMCNDSEKTRVNLLSREI